MPRFAFGAAVMVAAVGVVWLVVLGCGMAQPAPSGPKADDVAAAPPAAKPRGDDFPRRPGPAFTPIALRRTTRAMGYLEDVAPIRPRASGSSDGVTAAETSSKKALRGAVAARASRSGGFRGQAKQRGQGRGDGQPHRPLVPRQDAARRLCSHYDARPLAGQRAQRPRRWRTRSLGARRPWLRRRPAHGNGPARMKDVRPDVPASLRLFDGEEYVF